ncbi:hypothetical protein PIROE2DRAFT_10074 [Piromyces sp. E2]|nr:hypothetical protein PIROE2DRAFT_10074 [Piromyces sp. E2]|eukprot:OUM63413.1 hypothetical protein PIROE2DRAFT_10074 [Piromyces sp. E2]
MNEDKVCRICLSNTLNLFDDDLIQKIIKQSELEEANKENKKDSNISDKLVNDNYCRKLKNEENDSEQLSCNCTKEIENENEECFSHDSNSKSEQETENIWRWLKSINKDIIKKCIYDYYYEENKNDLFSLIENIYNSMVLFFIYILLIPRWVFWMTRNIFFFDIWKNPFLYYDKSCFKHNNENIDESYLSEMSYLKRRAFIKGKNKISVNEEHSSNEKIYNDDTFKPKIEISGDENDGECDDNSNCNSETIIEHDKRESEKSNTNENDSNNDDTLEMNNSNSNVSINKNYEKNSFNKLLRNSVMRTSSSLSSLNIAERTIKKANSLEMPLRKTSSGSFFHPFNDHNKSSLGIEKDRNILRSSYMSLDEFFRNLDSNDNSGNEDSYQKKFFNQKQKLKHSLYNTFSSFKKKIIDQPISYKVYYKCIYPIKVHLENTNKLFHYKKNKLNFALNVQKNLQKSWWKNQNKIKNYQKRYFFLNRIPEDVNYYIDKLISPCKCKGSQVI